MFNGLACETLSAVCYNPNVVLASHIIFTAYGFWLPNDPRGSWSDFVRNWEIYWFGGPTKPNEQRPPPLDEQDDILRLVQKTALRYPPAEFDGVQARAVARGVARAVEESKYEVYAFTSMQSHAHAVVGRHDNPAERIISHLKARGTQQLIAEGIHPLAKYQKPDGEIPRCWARRGWKVFLDSVDDIERAISYVEDNPVKEGKRRQNWTFVKPYEG